MGQDWCQQKWLSHGEPWVTAFEIVKEWINRDITTAYRYDKFYTIQDELSNDSEEGSKNTTQKGGKGHLGGTVKKGNIVI